MDRPYFQLTRPILVELQDLLAVVDALHQSTATSAGVLSATALELLDQLQQAFRRARDNDRGSHGDSRRTHLENLFLRPAVRAAAANFRLRSAPLPAQVASALIRPRGDIIRAISHLRSLMDASGAVGS